MDLVMNFLRTLLALQTLPQCNDQYLQTARLGSPGWGTRLRLLKPPLHIHTVNQKLLEVYISTLSQNDWRTALMGRNICNYRNLHGPQGLSVRLSLSCSLGVEVGRNLKPITFVKPPSPPHHVTFYFLSWDYSFAEACYINLSLRNRIFTWGTTEITHLTVLSKSEAWACDPNG